MPRQYSANIAARTIELRFMIANLALLQTIGKRNVLGQPKQRRARFSLLYKVKAVC
jgi:hypothetical protein